MKKLFFILQLVVLIFVLMSCVYQRPDMRADMSVPNPEFIKGKSPVVLFDAGHNNFHDITTTYAPFARLLENDGISISNHNGPFTRESLKNTDLLIIANAMTEDQPSAFSEDEIQVVVEWVEKGSSLLFIADHDPFGSASAALAEAFGVGMESVWTVDTLRVNKKIGKNTWLEYSRENSGLGDHSILQGGSPEIVVNRVITFTGQSLSFDTDWTSILQLSPAAQNYYLRSDASVANPDTATYFAVPNQSQMIVRDFGKGRIVIAGEAAMFTAQEARIFFKKVHAGFNYKGYDNKQFVLNIVHWLLFKFD